MKLNDKLKSEAGVESYTPWDYRNDTEGEEEVMGIDDVNKLIETAIKHCAEVVGEQIENMEIAKAMGKELEVTCYNQALLETQQRLLDLIK